MVARVIWDDAARFESDILYQNSFDEWKTVCCDKNAYPQGGNLPL